MEELGGYAFMLYTIYTEEVANMLENIQVL